MWVQSAVLWLVYAGHEENLGYESFASIRQSAPKADVSSWVSKFKARFQYEHITVTICAKISVLVS
jgi:hypothetical protein